MNKSGNKVLASVPPRRIRFETNDIPQRVLEAFEETVTCYANSCYVAAAMLLRKCVEELCEERGGKGVKLDARIKDLGNRGILQETILEAMDDLKFLGNDAAHFTSKTYQQIGEEEARVGIRVTKTILEVVYQHNNLLDELKALKKSRPANTPQAASSNSN